MKFTPHYSVPPKTFVIFLACFLALVFVPQSALAQHGGGGGHAGGHFGGGHFGGGHSGRGKGHGTRFIGAGTHNSRLSRRFPRGGPFFGSFFGGFDLSSPTCGTFWIWGFGCDSLPHYGFGFSNLTKQQDSLFTGGHSALNDSPEAVLYLVDGTVSGLKGYWFAGGKLHYVTDYGFENAVGLDAVDLQETVNENALRGIKFTLQPTLLPSTPLPSP